MTNEERARKFLLLLDSRWPLNDKEKLVQELKDEFDQVTLEPNWEDREDEWTSRIAEAHPTRSGSHEDYACAMRMVGARHSKRALVDLVNWLLIRNR